MKALASFIMQGRWQPVVVVAGATLVPLLVWVGGAALALVTLRRGAGEGLLVAGLAAIVVGAFFAVATGQGVAALGGVLEYWGPVLLLAWLLRVTVSLPLALMAATAGAAIAVLLWHAVVGDPVAFWESSLAPLLEGEQGDLLAESLLPVLSGFWILGLWVLAVVSLLLARWWQAMLYNPGGFGDEFRAFRLDYRLGLGALALLLADGFTGPGPVHDLALLLAALFAVQALAVIHATRRARGWHWGLLVVAYGLLPLLFKAYAVARIADSWFDWRRRFTGNASGDGHGGGND